MDTDMQKESLKWNQKMRFDQLQKSHIALLVVTFLVTFALPFTIYIAQQQQTLIQSAEIVPPSPCPFQKADQPLNIAFCDSFDNPAGTGNRSGDLNGLVWGVSRVSSDFKTWHPTQQNDCGTTNTKLPEKDITICNGTLVESVSDEGAATILAMYPKQPFDIAGRTGTVVFDVNADSQQLHAAWPSFVYTDQPVPAPYHGGPGLDTAARNSFGFAISSNNDNQTCETVAEAFITRNYDETVYPRGDGTLDCVHGATQAGQKNHFEIRMSSSHVDVWATEPNSSVLKHIYSKNIDMPLTRGLVWMEEQHYNACKWPGTQCDHTFTWDNFGFDGPILPRDLAYDVNDNTAKNGDGQDIGWDLPSSTNSPLSLNTESVSNIDQASGAILTLNYWPQNQVTLSYRVNGNAWHTQPWIFGGGELFQWKTIAMPVPLTEIIPGVNKVQLASSDNTSRVVNINLILIGAGGISTCLNPSNCSGTPVTPVNNPTSVPTTIPTSGSSNPTNTPIPTQRPTAIPTAKPTNVPTTAPTISVSGLLLGNTKVESGFDSNNAGEAEKFPFTAVTTGSVGHLFVYLSSQNTATNVIVGLYDNNGQLLTKGTISNPVAGKWNVVGVSSASITSGGKYWIAVLSPVNKGTLQFRDRSGGTSYSSSQSNLSALPQTWSNGRSWSTTGISAYASQ